VVQYSLKTAPFAATAGRTVQCEAIYQRFARLRPLDCSRCSRDGARGKCASDKSHESVELIDSQRCRVVTEGDGLFRSRSLKACAEDSVACIKGEVVDMMSRLQTSWFRPEVETFKCLEERGYAGIEEEGEEVVSIYYM